MMRYTLSSRQKTGSAHRSCQDRFRVARNEGRLALIQADGHGGRPYTRSGLGARFACAAAEKVLMSGLSDEKIPAAVKILYDSMVKKHLAFRPLADWEQERVGSRPHEAVYGATLLAAVLTPDSTLCLQLGDGEIHALKADGTFFPSLPEDEGCCGNLTTSLANSRSLALRSFRLVRWPESAAAVMMFTDGCEGGMLQVAAGLADLPSLDAHLEEMLRSTNHGDDQTFLMAYDAAAVQVPAFQETLTGILHDMQEAARCAKQELRDREEYAELSSYLQLALRKAKRMSRKGVPELRDYLAKLKPSYERYLQLQAKLDAVKGD